MTQAAKEGKLVSEFNQVVATSWPDPSSVRLTRWEDLVLRSGENDIKQKAAVLGFTSAVVVMAVLTVHGVSIDSVAAACIASSWGLRTYRNNLASRSRTSPWRQLSRINDPDLHSPLGDQLCADFVKTYRTMLNEARLPKDVSSIESRELKDMVHFAQTCEVKHKQYPDSTSLSKPISFEAWLSSWPLKENSWGIPAGHKITAAAWLSILLASNKNSGRTPAGHDKP